MKQKVELNLKAKIDTKQLLAVHIYNSDYGELSKIAKDNGMSLSNLIRTILNNFLESK